MSGRGSDNRLGRLRDAMAQWVCSRARRRPGASKFDQRLIPLIQSERSAIRAEEAGGGMCHLVSEWLDAEYCYARLAVTYLGRDGAVITAHYVNVLPDGAILDGTADQFGEGHDVRLVRPDDPEYGRYRPEFDSDINPANEKSLRDWMFAWAGESDWDAMNRLRNERGEAWWVSDLEGYRTYLVEQIGHASKVSREFARENVKDFRRRLRDVEEGFDWNRTTQDPGETLGGAITR